jgi:peptidoglycan/LPS O-acetylase OafA/YrhL
MKAICMCPAFLAGSRVPHSGRIEMLDTLRGLAALLVLFQHLAETVIAAHALPLSIEQAGVLLINGIFHFGRFGVALFFLISGFVIPFSFRTDRSVGAFAISRAFRLYPAYWLSLGGALLVLHVTGAPAAALVTIAANVVMVQHYVGQPDIVVAYWTLATELAFYVLAACLLAAGLLRAPFVLAGGIVALFGAALLLALASHLIGQRLPADLPLHLGLMLLGTMLRLAMLERDAVAVRLASILGGLFLATVPLVQFMTVPPVGTAGFTLAPTLGYIGALLLFVAGVGRRSDWPSSVYTRVATWFGTISYSVYLFHGPVIMACGAILITGNPGSVLRYAALVLGVTILLSAIVYHFVEAPMVRLGHRVVKRRVPAQAFTEPRYCESRS